METAETGDDVRVRHPVRRTAAALLALAVAAGAVAGVRQQVGIMSKHSDMQLAFPSIGAIDGEQWKCNTDSSDGHYVYSCYPPDAPNPTVNYELLPAPETPSEVVAAAAEENRVMRAQDSTGTTPTSTLIGTADWTPTGAEQPWGTVTRWRYDRGEGGPLFQASYRYADAPYGLTVYADSAARIDELVRSITLLPPDQLPD